MKRARRDLFTEDDLKMLLYEPEDLKICMGKLKTRPRLSLNDIKEEDDKIIIHTTTKRLSLDTINILSRNTTITELNISGNISNNNIKDMGVMALAKNTFITTLDISCNYMGNTGIIALSENVTLNVLRIDSNMNRVLNNMPDLLNKRAIYKKRLHDETEKYICKCVSENILNKYIPDLIILCNPENCFAF